MAVPKIAESFKGSVSRVTLGATSESGGTRTSTVVVGGATNVVYGGSSDQIGEKPVIAIDVLDSPPAEWPQHLADQYKDVLASPAAWAKKCVEEFGANLICLKFDGPALQTGARTLNLSLARYVTEIICVWNMHITPTLKNGLCMLQIRGISLPVN